MTPLLIAALMAGALQNGPAVTGSIDAPAVAGAVDGAGRVSPVSSTSEPAAAVMTPAAPPSPCAEAVASGKKGTCVPALTPIEIAVRSHLGSKLSKTGDVFPIQLAAPIMIDGKEVLPAGSGGMGEVVHAKKSGGGGAGGELVLAARYLDVGGRHLKLRSMKLGGLGKDATGTVNAINVGAAASVPAVAVIGLFITGKSMDVPEGTVATAKTAEDFWVPAALLTPGPTTPDPPMPDALVDPAAGDSASQSVSNEEGKAQ